MSDRVKAKGVLKTPLDGNVVYDEKKQGTSLFGGRKNKYYKDGKKVAVVKSKVKKKNGDFSTKTKVRVTKNNIPTGDGAIMKKGMAYKKSMAYKESSKQEEENLLTKNAVDNRAVTMKKGPIYKYDSIAKMNSYDKDMMHERELIYDAKKQEKTGSKKTKSNDKKLIADAKNQIYNEDVAKKKHIVNEIAARNSRMA